jgi:hypothetical protein
LKIYPEKSSENRKRALVLEGLGRVSEDKKPLARELLNLLSM